MGFYWIAVHNQIGWTVQQPRVLDSFFPLHENVFALIRIHACLISFGESFLAMPKCFDGMCSMTESMRRQWPNPYGFYPLHNCLWFIYPLFGSLFRFVVSLEWMLLLLLWLGVTTKLEFKSTILLEEIQSKQKHSCRQRRVGMQKDWKYERARIHTEVVRCTQRPTG